MAGNGDGQQFFFFFFNNLARELMTAKLTSWARLGNRFRDNNTGELLDGHGTSATKASLYGWRSHFQCNNFYYELLDQGGTDLFSLLDLSWFQEQLDR